MIMMLKFDFNKNNIPKIVATHSSPIDHLPCKTGVSCHTNVALGSNKSYRIFYMTVQTDLASLQIRFIPDLGLKELWKVGRKKAEIVL